MARRSRATNSPGGWVHRGDLMIGRVKITSYSQYARSSLPSLGCRTATKCTRWTGADAVVDDRLPASPLADDLAVGDHRGKDRIFAHAEIAPSHDFSSAKLEANGICGHRMRNGIVIRTRMGLMRLTRKYLVRPTPNGKRSGDERLSPSPEF